MHTQGAQAQRVQGVAGGQAEHQPGQILAHGRAAGIGRAVDAVLVGVGGPGKQSLGASVAGMCDTIGPRDAAVAAKTDAQNAYFQAPPTRRGTRPDALVRAAVAGAAHIESATWLMGQSKTAEFAEHYRAAHRAYQALTALLLPEI